MKIFSWYMTKRFFKPFAFGLGVFALLVFLGDMFDHMNALAKSKATMLVVLQYLWLEVPYWTIRVIPMATLLATLYAITGFVQSGEWIAAQASGFESKYFWRPVLYCSLVITVLSFAAQETILPLCYKRARMLWQEKIHPEWEWDKYFDIALIGGPGQFITAKMFVPNDGRMERPLLEKVGKEGVERQLDAREARWDGAKWVFFDGVEREFAPGKLVQKPFKQQDSELTVPPRNLIPRASNPDEMSYRELKQYSERVAHLGIPPRQFEIAVDAKLAAPFTNFVICALGIPIALRLQRSSKIINFCAALGLSSVYLFVSEIGKTLGGGGQLAPLVAAWLPNFLFGAVAFYLIRLWGY